MTTVTIAHPTETLAPYYGIGAIIEQGGQRMAVASYRRQAVALRQYQEVLDLRAVQGLTEWCVYEMTRGSIADGQRIVFHAATEAEAIAEMDRLVAAEMALPSRTRYRSDAAAEKILAANGYEKPAKSIPSTLREPYFAMRDKLTMRSAREYAIREREVEPIELA